MGKAKWFKDQWNWSWKNTPALLDALQHFLHNQDQGIYSKLNMSWLQNQQIIHCANKKSIKGCYLYKYHIGTYFMQKKNFAST